MCDICSVSPGKPHRCRNCYTRTGGENMQRRTFGTAVRFLVAGGTLVSWFAMCAGCGSDTRTVNVAVLLSNSTVAAVQAVPLSFPHGLVFSPDITGAVTLTFTSPDTFTLV